MGRKPFAGVAGWRIGGRIRMGFHQRNQFAKRDGFGFNKETRVGDFAFLGGFRSDDFKGAGDKNHGMGWGLRLFGDKRFFGFDGGLNLEMDAFQFGRNLRQSLGDFGGEKVRILTVHSFVTKGFGGG